MYKFTNIEKFNAIIENSEINVGINPIAELCYGNGISRLLIWFPIDKLKQLTDDKTFADTSKLKHILHIRNCGNVDFTQLHDKKSSSFSDTTKLRASSFDIICFKVPCKWDGGKGFDYASSYFNRGFIKQNKELVMDGTKTISTDGVNWYQPRNGYKWSDYENGANGIYTNDYLSAQYDKFAQKEESVIVARQHFDIGAEDIDLDITDYVNKLIDGSEKNYGLCLAFSPMLECKTTEIQRYMALFTHKTNTIFIPQLKTIYSDHIQDDRGLFALRKTNRLYLYCNINGNFENLDELPTCTIEGINQTLEVKQGGRGIYYVEVKLEEEESGVMYYDVWSNLKFQGDVIEDVELYFTTASANRFFNVGSKIERKPNYVCEMYGIGDDEKVNQGDVRKLNVICRVPYTSNECQLVDKLALRLYVKDMGQEIDIIPFDMVNRAYLENFYLLDTHELQPQKYFVDVKFMYNGEIRVQKDILHFEVVSDATKRYL